MTTGARVSFSGSTITMVKTESALIQLQLRCALQQKLSAEWAFVFPFSVGVDDKTNFCLHLPFLNDIETRRPIAHLSIGGRGYSSEQVWTAWGEGFPCGRGGFLKWTSLNSSFWVSKWTSLTGLEGVSHVSTGSGSGRVPQVNKFEQVWNRRQLHGELPFSCDQNDRQTGLKTFPSLPGQKNTNDSLSHPTILTSVA